MLLSILPTPSPVFERIGDCGIEADAVIDFASAGAVDGLLAFCVDRKVPVYCALQDSARNS